MSEFGVVANVVEIDRVFRMGAKAWLRCCGNDVIWIAASRSGRQVEKRSPIWRFGNFRAAFIPPALRGRVFETGSRPEMEDLAARLGAAADRERAAHPNRRGQV